MSENRLRWGILGTGSIAGAFAEGLRGPSERGELVAVGSRTDASAETFGKKYAIARRHGSYDALIDDDEVDALYIATPHPVHAEWAIKAARAGKHLLVEKPIGVNAGEAMAIVEAARDANVFLMEAFMYRAHPQTLRLIELLQANVIGEVRMVQGAFGFHWPEPWSAEHRVISNELAGGGILDVGCYPVSMSRLIAGVVAGKPFADPREVSGSAHLGKSGVDEWAAATLKFPSGLVAQVSCSVQLQQENALRIYGSDGWILMPTPWAPSRNGGASNIIVHKAGEKLPEEIAVASGKQIYANEADHVAEQLEQGRVESPAMSWDDTIGNLRALDKWRAAVGLVYEQEKPQNFRMTTVTGRPLASSPRMRIGAGRMKYGKIAGVSKDVSRVVMGCDNQPDFPHAAVLFDDFFERGGNTFDTAHIYGGGKFERLLGHWINLRGVRDEVVVIAKGAHSPLCTPRDLSRQLDESLERLQTDHADLYLLHRDNPEIPVGEFVDALNEHKTAGRVRAFGGSNWSLARVDEANAYAKRTNQTGFAAVSNNFSLARLIEPMWPGCISSSDPASREWFTKTQTPLLAWSSQARGFFVPGRAAPDKTGDREMVRSWYSDDNFERQRRVFQLAQQKGILPINIALAYVLHQPFPAFALVGPRTLREWRTTLAALDIELSPAEMKWLNLDA
jgi:predicted dehydrogenase/aryl-alcohol dehydrogenase-like predicted oxidoreductase